MRSFIINIINFIVKPLVGKGVIDRYFPFLLHLYERVYSILQPAGYTTVSIFNTLKLRVSNKDTHIGNLLINKGEFEPLETAEFVKSITKDSIVFDIGANFGYYSIIAGSLANLGNVYAFEPDKNNFLDFKSNIELNNLLNVVAENVGVGDINSTMSFKMDGIHRGRSKIVDNNGDYTIDVVTLDSYCQSNNIENIDILKVDVEGFETKILLGAKEIIKKSHNLKLFIEFNKTTLKEIGLNDIDFYNMIKQVDLVPKFIVDESKKQILEFNKENVSMVFSYSTYCNLICSH